MAKAPGSIDWSNVLLTMTFDALPYSESPWKSRRPSATFA